MTTFVLRRGKGSLRRVAHVARYDQFGNVAGPWCHQTNWNLTSNVPWGRPTCKSCLRKMREANR